MIFVDSSKGIQQCIREHFMQFCSLLCWGRNSEGVLASLLVCNHLGYGTQGKKLIFEGRRLEIDDILEHVQILSWKWFHFRLVGFGYSISDWCQCSVAFLGVWNSGLYSRAS